MEDLISEGAYIQLEQKGAYIQGIIIGCIFCLQEDGPITGGWGAYKRRILYPRELTSRGL